MAPAGLGWAFLAIGLLMQIIALLLLRRPARLLRIGGSARGVVVDANGSMHTTSRGTPAEFFFPIVEFATRDGQMIRFTSETGRRVETPKGTVVRVLYDPAKPYDALMAAFSTIWLFPVAFCLFGMPFLLIGLFILR